MFESPIFSPAIAARQTAGIYPSVKPTARLRNKLTHSLPLFRPVACPSMSRRFPPGSIQRVCQETLPWLISVSLDPWLTAPVVVWKSKAVSLSLCWLLRCFRHVCSAPRARLAASREYVRNVGLAGSPARPSAYGSETRSLRFLFLDPPSPLTLGHVVDLASRPSLAQLSATLGS